MAQSEEEENRVGDGSEEAEVHDSVNAQVQLGQEVIVLRTHVKNAPAGPGEGQSQGEEVLLSSLLDHGVDPEYVRGLEALGYEGLPPDSLIRLRDHGVTPEYVRELKSSGQGRLSVDELIAVRDRGVTPDRIRVFEHIVNEHVRALRNAIAYLWPK